MLPSAGSLPRDARAIAMYSSREYRRSGVTVAMCSVSPSAAESPAGLLAGRR